MTDKPFQRVVLTGAAGKLGSVLREPLRALSATLVLSDISELGSPLQAGEEFVVCDLADHGGVAQLVAGADLIVHFGGASQEQAFEPILQGNIIGQFNLYDNALNSGVKRVILASSNHVTGGYRADEVIDASQPMRPDGLYAVSKGYGELLARFYHDRHGLETVSLRIGTCIARPKSARCLHAWLSYGDLVELVRCAALAPSVGCAVVYGVSNNQQSWWRGDDAERIGYKPRDSADSYREELASLRPNDVAPPWQGGNIFMRDYRKPETLGTYKPSEPPVQADPDVSHDC
ncbi:NAD(P)-dependent oxidoreductase [Uliginosibacterium sp. H3]|uniref:NAD(P)-dependent oxidoreductase n=1 Tax=Uliginosibacterium silvisoli TaxID=3114758 RepID=A0ABU6K4B1_9RHOO|nr:NAD(P)-dependent oxidoreductase [Uliginosibacterium sp. H3]